MIRRKRNRQLWSPTVAGSGWTDAQIEQFRSVLQPAGFQVNASEGRIVVTRVRAAA